MGILDFLLPTKSYSFIQAESFKGFKRYKIANHDYPEAQTNLFNLRTKYNGKSFKGAMIKLELIRCVTDIDALAIYVDSLRIGTIFFGEGNYKELHKAFKNKKLSAAYVKVDDDIAYLLVKMED